MACDVRHTLERVTFVSTRVRLRVSPGSSRAEIVGRHGDAWKVRVTAAPEQGRANAALVRLLADTLGVPRDAVTVVSGHGGRDKVVELAGVSLAQIEQRLSTASAQATPAAAGGEARPKASSGGRGPSSHPGRAG
jgi:uncharacterized protein